MLETDIPPVPVAGLAVPDPFQLPLGAIRNQINRPVISRATPTTEPLLIAPMDDPVLALFSQIAPLGWYAKHAFVGLVGITESNALELATPTPEFAPVKLVAVYSQYCLPDA